MAEFPLGDILQFAGGLWSGNQQARLQKQQMRHGIEMRVEDAKRSGIHPLAALGANIQPVPGQPVLGDAALGGLAAAGNKLGGIGSEAAELANKETESRIRRNNAETDAFVAQSRTIAGAARQPPGATRGGPLSAGAIGTIHANPRWSSAQAFQDRYGDLIENLAGAAIASADARYNRERRSRSARMRRISGYIRGGRRARPEGGYFPLWRPPY